MTFDVATANIPTFVRFAGGAVIVAIIAGVWLRDRWLDWRHGKSREGGSGQPDESSWLGGGSDGGGHVGGGGGDGHGGGDGGGGW
jgi:hypothetical protein